MAKLTKRLSRRTFGKTDYRAEGYRRTLAGLRQGDTRELYIGLAVAAVSYLRRTKPRKQLLYRRTVPEGSALVIHHKKSGTARLEIIKPKKRR